MDDKKRLSELALRASFTGRAQFTHFLEPAAERDALSAAHAAGAQVRFFGGYDGAERRVAAFYAEVPPEDGEYPVAALALRWNARSPRRSIATCWARRWGWGWSAAPSATWR